MVSGRHKAYEHADSPGDSLANDTSASAFSLKLEVREDAKIGKQFITIHGRRFSIKTVDQLAAEARNPKKEAVSLLGYTGEIAQPVEANGKTYVGLLKLQGKGGFRRFVVYDFRDEEMKNRVKEARMKLETLPHEQEGVDDMYLDDIADLEPEEY